MKIAIVGGRGLVGTELMRQLPAVCDVVALGRESLDITNRDQVEQMIRRERPAMVINCAVLGVDACEAAPDLASKVNVAGAKNVAEAAAAIEAEFLQFSSNYIFDGKRTSGSYNVDDAPGPLNVYGLTKLQGERAVIVANQRSYIVRTSWVFGAGKESFLSTVPKSLRAGRTIRAITDVFASATYVHDLVKRVIEIIAAHRYATYHVVNSGVCSFAEFAYEVACLLGISESDAAKSIETAELRDFKFAATRPYYTPMSCRVSAELGLAPMRSWRAALAAYVRETS